MRTTKRPAAMRDQKPNPEQRDLIAYLLRASDADQNAPLGFINMSTLRACYRRGWITFRVTPAGAAALTKRAAC